MVKPIHDNYQQCLSAVLLHREYACEGEIFDFQADLQEIRPFPLSAERLEQAVHDLVMPPPRALALSSIVARTATLFLDVVTERNKLIEEFRRAGPDRVNPRIYFGMPTERGIDLRYRTSVETIYSYADDLMYLTRMMGNDLLSHAALLRERLPKKLHSAARGIVSVNYEFAADIFPDAEKYRTFDTAFVEGEKPLSLNFWKPTLP